MPKTKLYYRNRLNRVWYVTKTKQDNDMSNHTSAIYVENANKLLWPIKSSEVHDKN